MPGMLSQPQGAPPQAPQPSSGPVTQTPPEAGPGAGNPSRDGAPGSGQPQDVEELKKQAIKLVYGERFDQLIKMFETNGTDGFPRSMAIAVNTALDSLEKENGPLPQEQAADVGMHLMMKLMEDIIADGVLPDVTLEQANEALPATLVMYADSHPDVSKEDVQMLVKQVAEGVAQAQPGGEAQPPAEPVPQLPPTGAM